MIKHFFSTLFLLFCLSTYSQSSNSNLPFSTNTNNITIWNGEKYVPFFVKGINLGVAKPGTYPGDLAAKSEDYKRWFPLMHEAGFNCIRLYTLHYPQFYRELKAYNEANPNHPLYVFHGVWLEEEAENYHEDLFDLESIMTKEITDNINAVHGNITIPARLGKAYGTFDADISPWVLGYIAGREIHPPEVLNTNEKHAEFTSFEGKYLSINNTRPSEVWLLKKLDYLLDFEQKNYNTQRPVSISSWPTLDPIEHPFEKNRYEDSAFLDFSKVNYTKAKAGFFISYHAYPYYPDFVGNDPNYIDENDYLGQNSYLGYLKDLKSHYTSTPLIIAEYGVPSSWGIAHYTSNGMYHGGYDEKTQGEINARLLENNFAADCGGGMVFSWIDEWFKRTWITDPMDFNVERRVLWHNVTSPEQNFGLIGYKKANSSFKTIEEFCSNCPIKSIEGETDFAYLHLKLNTQKHLGESEEIWISIDTYDKNLGESILPNGKKVTNRAEFALKITNDNAELFVTEAYDLYGIWHKKTTEKQVFQSTISDSQPWKMVRWKNNDTEKETQYIGNMKVNRLNIPKTSMDAVILTDNSIEIKLPWTLLNIVDPSNAEVMHDDKSTLTITETQLSDGISFGIFYNSFEKETANRFNWEKWNHANDAIEYKKESFEVIKNRVKLISGSPIAVADQYELNINETTSLETKNLLLNDISADKESFEAVLIKSPENGLINFESNGSFSYKPIEGFTGIDTFKYSIKTAYHWSEPVTVTLNISGKPKSEGYMKLYPNPLTNQDKLIIDSKTVIDTLKIYSSVGQLVKEIPMNAKKLEINLIDFNTGTYFVNAASGIENHTYKFVITN